MDQNKINADFSEIKETDLRIMLEDWLEGYRDYKKKQGLIVSESKLREIIEIWVE